MTFVGTDPLSELVWSPQKGLSLRCADGSFSTKKFSVLCGSGVSNMGSGLFTNEPINKENLITSVAACNGTRHSSAGSPIDDAGTMPLSVSSGELKTGEDVNSVLNIEVAESLEGRENKISGSPGASCHLFNSFYRLKMMFRGLFTFS
uniref:Uncharacterized protein MANES_03G168800 n=1 Tax=Rhizophora mucronata TaxID=61149 RepID=A0A2P2JD48_RHIMU